MQVELNKNLASQPKEVAFSSMVVNDQARRKSAFFADQVNHAPFSSQALGTTAEVKPPPAIRRLKPVMSKQLSFEVPADEPYMK